MPKSSSHDGADPYTILLNWKNGTLCYWRNNHLYSPKTKAKLEARFKKMIEGSKNIRDFQENNRRPQL